MVDLLQELTDIDTLHESEEGAEVLIDALVSSKLPVISVPEPRLPDAGRQRRPELPRFPRLRRSEPGRSLLPVPGMLR